MNRKCMVLAVLFLCAFSRPLWAAHPPENGGVVLALSGGGTKGLAHIGLFEVLDREKIPVRGIVGTSMGAIMGGLYAAGYSGEELRDIMTEEINLSALLGDKNNSRPRGRKGREDEVIYTIQFDAGGVPSGPLGFLAGRQLYNTLVTYGSRVNTADFNRLPIPYAAVATDLLTGDMVVLRDGNLADAMRASMSLPGIFEPWRMHGRLLVDGGLVANIPVRVAKKIFPGYPVIAVMVSSGLKNREELHSAVDVLGQMTTILTRQNMALDLKEADLVLRPAVGDLSLLGTGHEEKVIRSGVQVAEAHLPEIKSLVSSSKTGAAPGWEQASSSVSSQPPYVMDVRLEGFPPVTRKFLEKELASWEGRLLDTKAILDTCEMIEARDDLGVVGYRLEPRSRGMVDVVVEAQPLSPYEVLLTGYTSNINAHRWLGVTGLRRNLLAQGDVLEADLRIGKDWEVDLRYFSPAFAYERNEIMLKARKWHVDPENSEPMEWERYALGYYGSRWWGPAQFRYGVIGETLSGMGSGDEENWWGPYVSLQYDTLDDPQDPSRGFLGSARLWWANAEQLLWEVRGNWVLPLENGVRCSLQGGAVGGDASVPPHGAFLGGDGILLHRAHSPYMGDNLLWGRLGLQRALWKNGVIPVYGELFFAQGMLFDRSWTKTEDAWEVGIATFVPGRLLGGRIFVVYDDEGETTLGFEIGGPFHSFSPIPE